MADVTESNRSHWDEASKTYNTKFSKTIQQIIEEIQARKDWIGVDWAEDSSSDEDASSSLEANKKVRLLDYACGTGLVSRALAPYVTQSIGIDLTQGMVSEYNTSARNQGIPESEMEAFIGNLIDAKDPNPASLQDEKFFNFDIAVVGLGFHHFDDPLLAAKRLSERLKKSGVLMIVDFLPHAHHGAHAHAAAHTVTHMGFSEEQVRKMFEDAGAGGHFDYTVVGRGVVFHGQKEGGEVMKRSVFMARGTKV